MTNSTELQEAVNKELAIRELEKRYKKERDSFPDFVKMFFREELNKPFQWNFHYDVVTQNLEDMMDGAYDLVIFNIPPRHGKTEIITKLYPVWKLGNDPTLQVISTGYSANLTQTYSKEARDYYKSNTFHKVFPRASDIMSDQDTKEYWKLESGGSYYATGVGGTITGKGADCAMWDTKIMTLDKSGRIKEKIIKDLRIGERVLSWNHEKDIPEWKRVVATKRIGIRPVKTTSTVDGYSVTTTFDHPIFTARLGYIEAKDIKQDQRVRVFTGKEASSNFLFSLFKRVREELVRIYKASEKGKGLSLLWKGLLKSAYEIFLRKKVQELWKANGKKGEKILLKKVYQHCIKRNKKEKKWRLLSRFYTSSNKANKRKGWCLCCMWNREKPVRTSQGRKQKKRLTEKLNNGMSCLSYVSSPQISKGHTATRLEEVWDIQVEDNHNFFANGILIHNCFIIDDPLNPKDVESTSKIKLNWVNNWISNVAFSRLNNKMKDGELINGKMVIVMQRLHDSDLCGYLLDTYKKEFESGNWKHVSFPAIAKEDDEYRSAGEALFPARYPVEWLEKQKKRMTTNLGSNFYSAQYQQDPIDMQNSEFKKEYFVYYSEENIIDKRLQGVIPIDPAESEKQTADYRAISVVATDQEYFYLREELYGRWDTSTFLDKIFETQQAYNYPVLLERNQTKLLGEAIRSEMVRRNQYFTMYEIVNTGNKEERIRATLHPLHQNRRIMHNRELKGGEGEDELLRFPKAAHDDVIDAKEMGVRYLQGRINVHSENDSGDEHVRDTSNFMDEIF